MVYCSKCGKKNEDDAEFCSKCGAPLIKKFKEESTSFEKKVEDFAEDAEKLGDKTGKKVEEVAKRFGEAADEIGKRFEKKMDKAGKEFESWFDQTFGIARPLISSFFGLIILRFIIEVMARSVDDFPVLSDLSMFLYSYLLLFFVLMLLSSYNSYFYSKYKKKYRWFSPFFSSIGFIILIWIVSKIFIILDNALDIPALAIIASFIENYIIAIFVFVLIIGYLVLMFRASTEKS